MGFSRTTHMSPQGLTSARRRQQEVTHICATTSGQQQGATSLWSGALGVIQARQGGQEPDLFPLPPAVTAYRINQACWASCLRRNISVSFGPCWPIFWSPALTPSHLSIHRKVRKAFCGKVADPGKNVRPRQVVAQPQRGRLPSSTTARPPAQETETTQVSCRSHEVPFNPP